MNSLTSVVASRSIVTNSTARLYLGEDNEARVGWEWMNDHFGGMVSFDVLVEGEEENALQDPAVLRWMDGLTERLRALSGTGFASQTAYVASNDGGLTPAGSLANPFPQGIVQPSGSALGLLTGLHGDPVVMQSHHPPLLVEDG